MARIETLERRRFLAGVAPVAGVNPIDIAVGGFNHDTLFYADGTVVASSSAGGLGNRTRVYNPAGTAIADVPFSSTLRKVDGDEFETLVTTASSVAVTRYDLSGQVTAPTRTTPVTIPSTHISFSAVFASDGTIACVAVPSASATTSTPMLYWQIDATGAATSPVNLEGTSRQWTDSASFGRLWAIDASAGGGVAMAVTSSGTPRAQVLSLRADGTARFAAFQVAETSWSTLTGVVAQFASDGRFSVSSGTSWQRYTAMATPERSAITLGASASAISYQPDGDALLFTNLRSYYSDAQSTEVTIRDFVRVVDNTTQRLVAVGADADGWGVLTSQSPWFLNGPPAVMFRRSLREFESASGSISGLTFRDDTDDGIRQENETVRIAGVFELYSQAGDLLGTSTAGSNGVYSFADVIPNWPVYVKLTGTTVRFPVAKDAGSDDAIDSDFDPATRVVLLTLAPGEVRSNVDLGARTEHNFVPIAYHDVDGDGLPPRDVAAGTAAWSVTDVIGESLFYIDQNANDQLDAGETTWRGQRLLEQTGSTSLTSGGPALYVPPGTYRVGIVPKRGWTFAAVTQTVSVSATPGASNVPSVFARFTGFPVAAASPAAGTAPSATRMPASAIGAQDFSLDVDIGPSGDGIVLYESTSSGGAFTGLRARRFNSTGVFSASDVLLDASRDPSDGSRSVIKLAADGSFWVVLGANDASFSTYRRFDPNGAPLTAWLGFSTAPVEARDLLPGFSARADGSFASIRKDTAGVWVSWFAANGQLLAPETRVISYAEIAFAGYSYDTVDLEWLPSGETIAFFARGRRDVNSVRQEGATYVRRFTAPGVAAGEETFLDGVYPTNTRFSSSGHVAYVGSYNRFGRWVHPATDRSADIGRLTGFEAVLPNGFNATSSAFDIAEDGRIVVVQRAASSTDSGVFLRLLRAGMSPAASALDQQTTGGVASWTFNEDVSASLSVDDFELRNLTSGFVVPTSELALTTDASKRFVRLNWPALDTGQWQLTLKANSMVSAVTGQTNALPITWSGTVIRGSDGPDRVDVSSDFFLEARLNGKPSTAAADVRFPLQVVDFGLLDLRGGDDTVVAPPDRLRLRVSGGAGFDLLNQTIVSSNFTANDDLIALGNGSRYAHDGIEQFDVSSLTPSSTPNGTITGSFAPGIRVIRPPQVTALTLVTATNGTARFAPTQAALDPLLTVRASAGRFEFTGNTSVYRLEMLIPAGRPAGAATSSIAFLPGVQHVFVQSGLSGVGATAGFLDIGYAALISQPGTPSEFTGWVKAALSAPGNGGIGSTAATSSNQVVGVAPASAIAGTTFPKPFAGYSLQGFEMVARVTLRGDANLDRVVDFDDLLKLAANYNATGRFWHQGDFNYDGTVNFDDLLLLAANYNQSLTGVARSGPASLVVPSSPPGVSESSAGPPVGLVGGAAPPRVDDDAARVDEDDSLNVLA